MTQDISVNIENLKKRVIQDERERLRYMKIALKFQYGGMVGPYEADRFLGIEKGTVRRAYLSGRIRGVERGKVNRDTGELTGKVDLRFDAHELLKSFKGGLF